MNRDLISSRKSLAAMIRKSTLLSETDQTILLTGLDAMPEKMVVSLARLFKNEQDQIQDFYCQARQIKSAYQADLIKTKKKLGHFLEKKEYDSDTNSAQSLLTDLL